MSIFKDLAGQTIVYGFGHVLGKVLNYVLIAFYLTRKLGENTAEYGIYNEMYFYVAILLILLGLRMETTFFRFGTEKDGRGKAFGLGSTTMLISGLSWLLIAIIFGDQIAAALSYPERGVYVKVLSALVAVDLLIAMPLAKMRLEGRPGRFVSFQVSSIVLNILLVLFFLEVCPRMGWEPFYHPHDILLDVFLANLYARVIILLLLGKDLLHRFDWDPALWLKMLSYAWPLVLVGIAGVINQSSYIILQKYLLGGEVMENMGAGGIYAAAAKIALLMSIFVTAYNFAAEPFFFNQIKRDDAPYIYAQMARLFAWVAGLLFLVITIFMDLFQFIVDANYRSTMFVVPIILLGYVFLGLYYNVAVWYKVTDKTRFGAVISLVGVIVTFGLNAWLLPQVGVVASAWASMACYAIMLLLCWFLGRQHYPVPYAYRAILLAIGLAVGLFYINMAVVDHLDGIALYSVKVLLLLVFLSLGWWSEKKKITELLGYQ
jgi:O-antigen/teichoic acid export membrane protein